ncbi:MAG: ROK family transcriptional regulator [Candidatus Omnitrophica bacterium]|nr:ROK family transcriptional regulator [Candidatus Omnitrophota bacterium]
MKTEGAYRFSFQKLCDKDIKSLKILELISKKGIISRTEIAKTTGINIVSISNYIKKYIDNKLIVEKGFDVSTGGRKPELVELNKENDRVIGVDIGHDVIRVVLADLGLSVIGKASSPKKGDGPKETLATTCDLIEEVIKKAALTPDGLKAIGVGTDMDDYDFIAKEIKKKFSIETFVGDEPSCGAFGEKNLNKNMPVGDMVYIYSDIGSGVVVREDGNRIASDESRYLSPWKEGLGIISLAKGDVARGVGTAIVEIAKGKMENITKETVIEAAVSNDEVALSIMRSVGMSLGLRIAYLINLFAPQSVVIGGGVEIAGDLILGPIKKTVKKLSLKDHLAAMAIMPGILGEEAVSMGAAYLAAREMFLRT